MKLCCPTSQRMSMNPYSRQVKSNVVNLSYTNLCPMISNLYEKVNYLLIGETLSLYLRLGMKMKRINRVLRFVQYPWLKLYIKSNRHEKKDQECVQKRFVQTFKQCHLKKRLENARKRQRAELVSTKNH